ncbi:MAG: class I SAM-dependent methyltransferase [Desulfobacteraceae bacterium]|nr:class I SAM-dependent methyltransferase [Desulfobacteraceae bacterium]
MKISKHYFNWADPKSQLVFLNETKNFTVEERYYRQAENLINCFELHVDDLILDYGCGIGKHAIYLNKKGYNVVGFDISEHYIKKAKDIMEQEGVQLDFHYSADFFDAFCGRFNFIYTIDLPFYCLDKISIDSLFLQIKKLFSDNGKFLLGFPYSRENREHFLPRNKWDERNGLLHLTEETIDEEGRRTERYIVIDIENESVTEWIDENRYY